LQKNDIIKDSLRQLDIAQESFEWKTPEEELEQRRIVLGIGI
jgi:hypothetical protein